MPVRWVVVMPVWWVSGSNKVGTGSNNADKVIMQV